jgi:hypothetical protein
MVLCLLPSSCHEHPHGRAITSLGIRGVTFRATTKVAQDMPPVTQKVIGSVSEEPNLKYRAHNLLDCDNSPCGGG